MIFGLETFVREHETDVVNFWGKNNPQGVPSYFFFGAVRLDYETAKRADVEKQNYTVCPRCWYVDAVFVCRECREEFVFSADEQAFWYEVKKFYVDSIPRRCVKCRKAERAKLEMRKEYDASIAEALARGAKEESKRRVIQIVDELEAADEAIPERMKDHRELLRGQLKKME